MDKKILLILDCQRSSSEIESISEILQERFKDYDFLIEVFNPKKINDELNPYRLQLAIDSYANMITNNNEYLLAIVEGFASFFWMRTFYEGKSIVINPILNPLHCFEMSKETVLEYVNSLNLAGFNIKNMYCFLDKNHRPYRRLYGTIFSETTVVSSEKINADMNFWRDKEILDSIEFILNEQEQE